MQEKEGQMVGKRETLIVILIALCSSVCILIFIFPFASAKTITVDHYQEADYHSIQNAINASEDGDVIRVYKGLYEENVVVDKAVSLIGNGSANTIIDGSNGRHTVNITADRVTISSFNITGDGRNYPNASVKVTSSHNTLTNNEFSNNYYGLYFESSTNCTIIENTCSSNLFYGIVLNNGGYCVIVDNTYNEEGLYLYNSDNCDIKDNICNDRGIYLEDSNNCTIEDNSCNGYYGIQLRRSGNCTIMENTFKHDVISLDHSINCSIKYNNCSSKNGKGIHLKYSISCEIENNIISINNGVGIQLQDSIDCNIENNTCSVKYEYYGIELKRSRVCTIANNTCSFNGGYGIYLQESSYCILFDNTFMNNRVGIGIWKSRHCTIANNTCSNNNDGITLFYSNCILKNNICTINNQHGIGLLNSNDCKIEYNTITGNRYGIQMYSSSRNNTAHYNNIYENTAFGIRALKNDYNINATHNYWGSKTGPYNETLNPHGNGDNVTNRVTFDPWYDSPITRVGEDAEEGDGSDTDGGDDTNLEIFILSTMLLILVAIFISVLIGLRPQKNVRMK